MRERDHLISENVTLIVKLLGAPVHLINSLSLPFFGVAENIAVLTLNPNFDLMRRKVFSEHYIETYTLAPMVLNLVFDSGTNGQITADSVAQIAETTMAHCNASHLGNIEEFSTYIITLALPNLRLPEDFWIPVESRLTLRELEVLSLVYQGLSSKKIAQSLNISHRTIELHRQNCAAKLGPITPLLLEGLFSTKAIETYHWGILHGRKTNTGKCASLTSASL